MSTSLSLFDLPMVSSYSPTESVADPLHARAVTRRNNGVNCFGDFHGPRIMIDSVSLVCSA